MYYTNAGRFFQRVRFIRYGRLDNKFVFQQICRILAPQFELFNTFFTFVEFFLPDQAAHLSERKRNFNERDTHCKIKRKIEIVSYFQNLGNKHTTMRGVFAAILPECRVCCPVDLPYTLMPFKKANRSYISKTGNKCDMNLYGYYSFSCEQV